VTGPPPPDVVVRVAGSLRFLLPARDRPRGTRRLRFDPTATVGHVVQAAGVPLTEVGAVTIDGARTHLGARTLPDAVLDVAPVGRPQPMPAGGFLADVGLGSLTRRLRLLGLDVAWSNDATDDDLVRRAAADDRVLLTQDRRLLMRRGLARGALVRGSGAAAQLADVLDRFDPPTAPLTRCTVCGHRLAAVPKADVVHLLAPGTRRSYQEFFRCVRCGRVYWRGAHARRIDQVLRTAREG
jgi:uncharacterized protein with PIN domain